MKQVAGNRSSVTGRSIADRSTAGRSVAEQGKLLLLSQEFIQSFSRREDSWQEKTLARRR
jgi:hypothetical protein